MTHTHQTTDVNDTDLHLKIDPVTRKITNESGKTVLMQGDHNSERFTFVMPRYIDEHDMSLCDIIEIHYSNVGQVRADSSSGIYEVDDLQVSSDNEETVTFSWLVSSNATKYPGTLNFVAHFACSGETDGSIEYSWDTDIFIGFEIKSTIHNSVHTVNKYADVLERWKDLLFNANNTGLSNIEIAVKDAIKLLEDTGEAIIKVMEEKGDATAAQSWAVGGTGTRPGEDKNNSWYWALEAAKEAIKAKEAAESVGKIEVTDNKNISGSGVGSKMELQTFLDIVGEWFISKVVTHENFPEDFVKLLKNDGVTTKDGYALDAKYGKKLKDSIDRIHQVLRATLTAAGWEGDTAPYTQTVIVEGITMKDDPIMVSLLEEAVDVEIRKAYIKAYGIVAAGTGITGEGSVTFKVNKKPAIDIDVGLTRLRGEL